MTALVPSSVKPDTKTDQDHPNQGGVCNYSCFTLFFTVYRLRKKVSREQIQEDARCLFSNISEETQIFLFHVGAISSKAMQPGDTVAVTPQLI